MQAINSNGNDNQDPIQELPNEMFTSILSLLPPSSIAHSSAASRSWRARILSTPALHQVIDLTKLKDEDKDLLPIVYHFQRLSFLSLNQLTRVSLNITPFWSNHLRNHRHQIDQTFGAFDVLLTTLRLSQKTLKGITLIIDGPGWHWESDHDLLPYVLRLLRSMKTLTTLQSICLEAPIWFSLKAGNSGSKMITVLNKHDQSINEDRGWTDSKLIAEFIQEVKRMSGGSLTEFLSRPSEPWEEEESFEILEELLDCSALKRLDATHLHVLGKELWDFIFRLRGLRSLNSSFWGDAQVQDESLEILQAPRDLEVTTELVNLELCLIRVRVDWKSISKWAGHTLERLVLRLDSQSIRGFNGSMISNSLETLKELHISNEHFKDNNDPQDVTLQNSNESKLLFPNLEELHLYNVEASIFQLFSNAELPGLQSTHVYAEDSSLASPGFNCLMNILAICASKIVHLKCSIRRINSFQCPQSSFDFSSLETLVVGRFADRSNIELPRWLVTSLYPNLSSMSIRDLNTEQQEQIFSNLKAMGKAPKLEIK